MLTNSVVKASSDVQHCIYRELNKFSLSHEILGRCSAPFIALADVVVDTMRSPLCMIESIAMAAMNLVAAAFSDNYSLKHALLLTEGALCSLTNTPVKLIALPFKFVFQTIVTLVNPKEVNSINASRHAFGQERV